MKPLFPREKLVGEGGHYKTQALFHEWKHLRQLEWTPYTLKEYDHPSGPISMHQVYVNAVSEYEAAMILLGSWAHWKKLCECTWFKPYKQSWDEERRLKDETESKRILKQEAEKGNVAAAKTLYEGPKAMKGRPSKDEKQKFIKKEIEIEELLTKAYSNIVDFNGYSKAD